MEKENPNIQFDVFLANDLEKVFFQLNEADMLTLDFDIDQRKAVAIAREYLENVEIELDREIANSAFKMLENSKDIIFELGDKNLSLEYEILECRCLRKLERVVEAKEKYVGIAKRFPKDPRALLHLAEICLINVEFSKSKGLLDKAKEIDSDYWLLKLVELVRKKYVGENIDLVNIDEESFLHNPRIKANFYRVYSIFLDDAGDRKRAESFVENAIYFNPNRLDNYITKLALIESRLYLKRDASQILRDAQDLFDEIENVESKFLEYGDIGARNKAILNVKKLNVLHIQKLYMEYKEVSEKTLKLAITCRFDNQIDQIITHLLMLIEWSDADLRKLLEYLTNSKKEISEELLKELICQFNIKSSLFSEGKKFFEVNDIQKYLGFIDNLENRKYGEILEFLGNDTRFAIAIANTLKNFSDLRRKIIENLPDDKNIQKEKMLLLLNFDENNFNEAFEILKQIDLTGLGYLECRPILQIIQEKKAWDFEIIVLEKLLESETNEKEIYNLRLQLFSAYINLKKYPKVIEIGKLLLQQDSTEHILDTKNREILLSQTIFVCLERGKIDTRALSDAKKILQKYQLAQPTFEFRAGVEAEVYIANDEPAKALEAIIEGVKIKKHLTPEEYVKLYFLISIKIGNKTSLNLDSLNKVEESTFVKLKNNERWYFVGGDNELDAIKIVEENDNYPFFINRILGDKIVFRNKYSSENREKIIEKIFPIEKYILWQAVQNFQTLSKDNALDGVQMIEMPKKGGSIDTKYLENFLKDLHKRTEPFFEIYCKNNVPLAMLAVSEGGLTNAISQIQQENKGFINFSTGTPDELEKQKNVVKGIIDNKTPFYIDGTSALVLAEAGLFKKIGIYLPNLKVPQSVIGLLIDTAEKIRYIPGQTARMGYAQGRVFFSSSEQGNRDFVRSNFLESINLLEAKPENISIISLANKFDCFSEQEVPEELSDACVLAQRENLSVLTEDFLYLKMNELETKKNSPEYFSSFALLRVLYEEGKVDFDEYLDFFGYLSSYRFRFLSLNYDDIKKAVFGDGEIKIVNPENIRKFNFPITLSEEYGVPFQTAFTIVGGFLLAVLLDNTITVEITEKIFIEIIETFPVQMNKKEFGQMFLRVCVHAIEQNKSGVIYKIKSKTVQEKIEKLFLSTEIYNFSKSQIHIIAKQFYR
ncbi:MAG: hypothetical protein ACTSXL_01320 [Alphaproteobacteria bacterium]